MPLCGELVSTELLSLGKDTWLSLLFNSAGSVAEVSQLIVYEAQRTPACNDEGDFAGTGASLVSPRGTANEHIFPMDF